MADQANTLCGAASTGATTALAVTVFHALNEEIRDKTGGASDLDEVLRQALVGRDRIGVARLQSMAADIIGAPSDALHIDKLPGCNRMTSGDHSN